MQRTTFQVMSGLKRTVVRGVLVFCLATTLAVSVGFLQDAQPVSAAPTTATSRQDRRPDRERSVSTTSTTEGFSQHSSSSSHARPRLIRR